MLVVGATYNTDVSHNCRVQLGKKSLFSFSLLYYDHEVPPVSNAEHGESLYFGEIIYVSADRSLVNYLQVSTKDFLWIYN